MKKAYTYSIPELKELYRNADKQIRLYEDKPTDLILFKLSESTWNIREIAEHLTAFNRLYLRQVNEAITEKSPLPQSGGPFQPRWIYKKWAVFFEPPYKFKMKTFPLMEPKDEKEVKSTFDALHEVQSEIMDLLAQAENNRWNLEKIKGRNPVIRILPMSLIEFLVLIEVHQRRHFWQIEQILKKIGE